MTQMNKVGLHDVAHRAQQGAEPLEGLIVDHARHEGAVA